MRHGEDAQYKQAARSHARCFVLVTALNVCWFMIQKRKKECSGQVAELFGFYWHGCTKTRERFGLFSHQDHLRPSGKKSSITGKRINIPCLLNR